MTDKKNGTSTPSSDYLNSPCTITEAVQIARGVVDDGISNYHASVSPLQLVTSISVDIIKSILVEKGVMTEKMYEELYSERVATLEKSIKAEREYEEANRKDAQTTMEDQPRECNCTCDSCDCGVSEEHPYLSLVPNDIEVQKVGK